MRNCLNCGAQMQDEDRVCGVCGAAASGGEEGNNKKRKRPLGLILLGLALVFSQILTIPTVGGYNFYEGNKVVLTWFLKLIRPDAGALLGKQKYGINFLFLFLGLIGLWLFYRADQASDRLRSDRLKSLAVCSFFLGAAMPYVMLLVGMFAR